MRLPTPKTRERSGNACIYVISGLTDIEIAGNQTFRNTLKYLCETGYRLRVFTFMPARFPNLDDPERVFDGKVQFRRLPRFLSPALNIGKAIKELIGRHRKNDAPEQGVPSERTCGTYLREYNGLGRICFIVFMFLLYVPVEYFRVLGHVLLSGKPDLLYGVNCQGAVVAGSLGSSLRLPVITRFHGVSVSLSDLDSPVRRFLVSDEVAGLKAKADAVIVANDGTRGDEILKKLGTPGEKVFFWTNGLTVEHLILPRTWDPDGFKRSLGLQDKKVMLMVSRLVSWKRMDRGIYCMHALLEKYCLRDTVLLIVGEGPERTNLEMLATNLGIAGNVCFAGPVANRDIAKYFSIADVFLSLYDVSNLGNPVLEALYMGVPIVSINDGSTRALLEDGTNGALIDPANINEQLPKTVCSILEDRELRQSLTAQARQTGAEKVLSWQKRLDLEIRVIEKVIGRNAAHVAC